MKIKKLITHAFIAFASLTALPIQAQQTLRASHAYQPNTSVYVFWEELAKGVNEKSNGKLNIQVFHSGQLGGDEQTFRGMKLGTIHMGSGAAANQGVVTDAYYWMDLPYIFKSRDGATKVFSDEVVNKYLNEKLRNDSGTTLLGHIEVGGYRLLINKSRLLKTPADTRGLKFRALSNPSDTALLKAWGFTPTPLPWNDTYPSLEQGMIDGLNLQAAAIKAFGFQDLAKYATETNTLMTFHVAQINTKAFDKLSPELQQLIRDEASRALKIANEFDRKDEQIIYEELKKQMTIYTPTPEEMKKWEDTALALWPELSKKLDKTFINRVVTIQNN